MTYILAAAGPRGLIHKIAILQEEAREAVAKNKTKDHWSFSKTEIPEALLNILSFGGARFYPNLACVSQGAAFFDLSSLFFLF